MADKFISLRNLRFLVHEVFDAESLTKHDFFKDHDKGVFDMVLETGMRLGKEVLFPAFAEMDRKQPEYDNGKVKVHPVVRTFSRECGEGGWISAHAPYDEGGQQMPNLVLTAFRAILCAANYSAAVYPFLTTGAAHLIQSFGTEELKQTYIPKMYEGKWQGTMALTEPQAGTSLTDLTTTATPTNMGYYLLKGQKIFISCAEHEGTDNVVNLLLARIQGAPPGVKGISLFVVPKLRPEGDKLVQNDIVCTGIYHKLGYRGAPITQLELGEHGNCRGWLVGEEHKGLRCMFQMMNEARIDVGMSAAAIANAAYEASLQYTRERPQGRKITEKDPTKPQIPIIEHADVKRMLLFQRAVVEGAMSLILQCAKYVDLSHEVTGEEKEKCELLLDLLTPIAKSYPSEMGVLSVSAGLQCLGGYGYCDEFPLEQYYRDVRIHPIHEGTTGVQGMDLLGRKVVMKNGKAAILFIAELAQTIEKAKAAGFTAEADALAAAVEKLKAVTGHLTGIAMKGDIELFLADATLYLEFFGLIAIAWQWLIQALTAKKALAAGPSAADAAFYEGKLQTCRYFINYELPKTEGLAATLLKSSGVTMRMKTEWFED